MDILINDVDDDDVHDDVYDDVYDDDMMMRMMRMYLIPYQLFYRYKDDVYCSRSCHILCERW